MEKQANAGRREKFVSMVSDSEASRSFSDLLGRVKYGGEELSGVVFPSVGSYGEAFVEMTFEEAVTLDFDTRWPVFMHSYLPCWPKLTHPQKHVVKTSFIFTV